MDTHAKRSRFESVATGALRHPEVTRKPRREGIPFAAAARTRAATVSTMVAMVAVLGATSALGAPVLPTGFTDELIAGGLHGPVGFAFLPDGRVLVVERTTARVRMIVNGAIASTDPVLTVQEVESAADERGLLGIAIDPGWPARPYVYVFYTATGATSRLSRFTATNDLSAPAGGNLTLDPSSRHDVLTNLPDAMDNHNGGTLRFGIDGMLYVSLGEDANPCAAQDTVGMKGVLLRLDVSGLPPGPGGPPARGNLVPAGNPFASHPSPEARLVWAFGFRNPFRFQVDPLDGSLFVSDVGAGGQEEVDHVTGPGQNFGWPRFEGYQVAGNCPWTLGTLRAPIHAYDRGGFTETPWAAIVGAGIYRGGSCSECRFPLEYLGDYFFADFYEGFLRRLEWNGSGWSVAPPVPGQPTTLDWARGLQFVADFQFGADGALWYCRYFDAVTAESGEIHRIVATPVTDAPDPRSAGGVVFEAPRPQPAADRVVLAFEMPQRARVSLDVYDAAGRRIERLVSTGLEAGRHEVAWERGTHVGRAAAGLYLARLEIDGEVFVRRIVMVQ